MIIYLLVGQTHELLLGIHSPELEGWCRTLFSEQVGSQSEANLVSELEQVLLEHGGFGLFELKQWCHEDILAACIEFRCRVDGNLGGNLLSILQVRSASQENPTPLQSLG